MLLSDLSRYPRHLLMGDINSLSASRAVQWLLDYSGDEELFFIINSGGGSVSDMLSIYDAIQLVPNKVHIVAMGACQSAAVTLITATERELRYATPNARFMMHPASQSGQGGTSITCNPEITDLEMLHNFDEMTGTQSVELYTLQARMIELLARSTFLAEEELRKFFTKAHFFWPQTAIEYGLIGGILELTQPRSSEV